MPALALDHVNIRVPADLLGTVRAFYVEVVGLTDGFRPPFGSAGHWLYAGEHAVIHLSVLRDDNGQRQAGGSVDHLAFRCSGLDAACRDLDRRGIAYRRAEVPLTGQVQLFVRDPAGNGVELNFAQAELQ